MLNAPQIKGSLAQMVFFDEDDSKSSFTDVVVDVVIGLVFCVGIVASFIPQHMACWKARSAEGLSLSTLTFAALSMTTRLLATYLGDHGSIVASSGILEKFDKSMPSTLQAALTVLFSYPCLIYYFAWGARARLPKQSCLVDGNDGIDDSPGIAVSPPTTPTIAVPSDTRRYAEMCSTVVVLVVVGVATAASAPALVQQDLYQQESQIDVWGGVAPSPIQSCGCHRLWRHGDFNMEACCPLWLCCFRLLEISFWVPTGCGKVRNSGSGAAWWQTRRCN
jgi:uncharacterized protein with PQ loop repeat